MTNEAQKGWFVEMLERLEVGSELIHTAVAGLEDGWDQPCATAQEWLEVDYSQ